MAQPPYNIAIQVKSQTVQTEENPQVVLSSDERAEISRRFEKNFTIHWLPPSVRKRTRHMAGIDATVYIFIQGLVVGSLLKPFFESMVKEAGKDFWTALKRVAARIWKAQNDKSYHLHSTTYFIFQIEEDFLAIPVQFFRRKNMTLAECEENISQKLEYMGDSWDGILADIKRFRIGKKTPTVYIHVITEVDVGEQKQKKWILHRMESGDFFGNG